MLISQIKTIRNNGYIQYKNLYASKINFKGQLETDYFEASKTGDVQKQIRSLGNISFDIREKDLETMDNFLHVALKSQNKQLINNALRLLMNKETDIVSAVVDEKNSEGKKPYEYTTDTFVLSRLENLANKQLSYTPVTNKEPVDIQSQNYVRPENTTTRLNELPAGTVIAIPDDDDEENISVSEINEISKSETKEVNEETELQQIKTVLPLNEIAGLTNAKEILQEKIVEPLNNNRNVTDSGFLLYGPTGSGKGFLLQSLAKSLNKEIITTTKLEQLVEETLTQTDTSQNENISKIFNENIVKIEDVQQLEAAIGFAQENYKSTGKQAIIYIDEIKGILPDVDAVMSNPITKVEGLIENSAEKGFILVATTREKDAISPNSLREKRFSNHIELKFPDFEERKEVFEKYLTSYQDFNIEELKNIIGRTSGFSYVNLRTIIDKINEIKEPNLSDIEKITVKYAKENNLGELSTEGTTANYDSSEFRRVSAKVTFDNVAGMKDVKEKFQKELIDRLKPSQRNWFKEHNRAPISSGFLLYGPPGTGKTFMAEAVAGETKIPMYKIDTSIIKDKYVGESEKKIRKLFKQLETKFEETGEYSILFIDEANSLLANRKKELSSDSLTPNSGDSDLVDLFLQYLNKAPERGVIPIVATNFKEEIDTAVLDRLNTKIEIQLPDDELREAMVRKELAKLPEYTKDITDADVKEIVIRLCGLSSRSITAILGKALDNCYLHQDRVMTVEDFTDEIKKYSIENNLPEINERDKTSAYDGKWKRASIKVPADFSDVAGMEDIKKVFQSSLIDRLKPEALERFKNDGNRNPIQSNFLLYGPPGTGKTFIAEAIAGEMKIPIYEIKSSSIKSGLYGESEKKLQSIFDQLENKFKKTGEYSILFIDEADDLLSEKNSINNADNSLTNLFLQMTNNSAAKGIIVIAATNYKDKIESAMLSRLGKQVYVPLPDKKLRKALIEAEIKKSNITENITEENIKELIEMTKGFSSRDISRILKETINEHLTYSDTQISADKFKEAIMFEGNKNDENEAEEIPQRGIFINRLKTTVNELTETEAEKFINFFETQPDKYSRKLKMLINSLNETEAENFLNLFIAFKEEEKV